MSQSDCNAWKVSCATQHMLIRRLTGDCCVNAAKGVYYTRPAYRCSISAHPYYCRYDSTVVSFMLRTTPHALVSSKLHSTYILIQVPPRHDQAGQLQHGMDCVSLESNLSLPLDPKPAPCGWRCPHRRPALTGPFGNVVFYLQKV